MNSPVARAFSPAQSRVAHSGEPVPECLGCNLLEMPDRCVEREGVVVCDQCEGVCDED